jgi:predicted aspartyl protease
MTSFSHDSTYDPPFPAIEVVLRNPEEGLSTSATMALLDTGADGTLAPLSLLRDILAPPLIDTRIRSHWGEWRDVQLFAAEIVIQDLNLTLPGVFVVGDEVGDEVILGRNVINKLRIIVDGPQQITEIQAQ